MTKGDRSDSTFELVFMSGRWSQRCWVAGSRSMTSGATR